MFLIARTIFIHWVAFTVVYRFIYKGVSISIITSTWYIQNWVSFVKNNLSFWTASWFKISAARASISRENKWLKSVFRTLDCVYASSKNIRSTCLKSAFVLVYFMWNLVKHCFRINLWNYMLFKLTCEI